jgi:LPS export ABC transporter permease LptF/LPS export ABC transporter permease LptG
MRLLTRYILREVLSHALLGGVLFTFVLFTSRLNKILEIVVRDSASLTDAMRLVAYFLPEALVVTIPMAVLVGILLGLSRLAADSEITAMRAAGMGALDFVRIVSLVSIGALALGLFNSLVLAPRSAAALLALQDNLKYSQASFEVEPRVFDEDFKNFVLYVQDVRPGSGAALWRHVFVADLTQPATPKITTAEQAIVTSAGPGNLNLHLTDGAQHDISPTDPNQYNISTFHTTDIPMQTGAQDEAHVSRSNTYTLALSLPELMADMKNPPRPVVAGPSGSQPRPWASPAEREHAARTYRIELNKRFSYPFACLVLMLVGVPLGLSSKRGGKSTGFVLTILLVLLYYFLSSVGVALANQGKLPPFLGVWSANIIFAAAGVLLLQQLSRGGVALSIFSSLLAALLRGLARLRPRRTGQAEQPDLTSSVPQRLRSMLRIQFPLILDDYIMREFAGTFALVLATFSMVFVIFTFFELIGDIIRNRIAFVTVGEYLLNLIPYILYNVTPLCVLVAVLVTFGGLAKTSEFTAMKACGLSLYRVVAPVLLITAVIAVALFAFDESYLPAANRRQEALRSEIKGKPAQTFLRPDRQWISGQTFPTPTSLTAPATEPHPFQNPAAPHKVEPARIFFYQFFDPDKNVFANLTVFEIDPATFKLTRRIFAASARWDSRVSQWILENGWSRTFAGEVTDSYTPFVLATFPEIHEQPQYFKKEDRQSQEMSFKELSSYIADLRQSGFDTRRLSVQLNRKLAYPAITLVMAILAVPFALSTGKRGGVAGFAAAILLAVLYLGVSGLFEAMGNVNTLPPTLAAWAADLLFAFAGAYFLLRTPT